MPCGARQPTALAHGYTLGRQQDGMDGEVDARTVGLLTVPAGPVEIHALQVVTKQPPRDPEGLIPGDELAGHDPRWSGEAASACG
jgi:hypothetical protein